MPRYQFLVLEGDWALLWWAKTVPKSTPDLQNSPKPGGCKSNSTLPSGYSWIAVLGRFWAFRKEHHREGFVSAFSFQLSKSEFFLGNPVTCRQWDKTRPPFLAYQGSTTAVVQCAGIGADTEDFFFGLKDPATGGVFPDFLFFHPLGRDAELLLFFISILCLSFPLSCAFLFYSQPLVMPTVNEQGCLEHPSM